MDNKTLAGTLAAFVIFVLLVGLLSISGGGELPLGTTKKARDNQRYENVLNSCLDKTKDTFNCRSAAEDAAETMLYWDGKAWVKNK